MGIAIVMWIRISIVMVIVIVVVVVVVAEQKLLFPCRNPVGVARFIRCVASNVTFPERYVNLRVSGA